MDIQILTATELRLHLDELVELLQDAVNAGASIGFYPPPLSEEEARAYWEGIIDSVETGPRRVIAALVDGRVVGSVQLTPETRRNQLHRADVQKLMVHRQYRNRGIGQALVRRLDDEAHALGLKLLVLDVVLGAPAERLYQRQGYVQGGMIPQYAISAEGVLETTVYYYKLLE
jgi:acetyltransferase